jgi:DNA-binding PadR family transcriptional regulator
MPYAESEMIFWEMSLIGETKMGILRELQDGPAHGYALAEALEMSSGGIYTHLNELEEEGMIEVAEQRESGRQQKYYELTENGELLLEALGED